MRRLEHKKNKEKSFVPASEFDIILRESFFKPAIYVKNDKSLLSSCVFCKKRYCYEYIDPIKRQEMILCPVNAISFNVNYPIIDKNCIGCGLCILRCPYGSIYLDINNSKPKLTRRNLSNYHEVFTEEFNDYFAKITFSNKLTEKEIEKFKLKVFEQIKETTQDEFYPLIGKILTYLGLPTSVTTKGDPNLRIDARIKINDKIIPIEIKSPTEEIKIGTKAVRQALENKIVVMSRFSNNNTLENSTLVIGFENPNKRSDVYELIDDIYNSYNIKIGLISFKQLFSAYLTVIINNDTRISYKFKDKVIRLKGRYQ